MSLHYYPLINKFMTFFKVQEDLGKSYSFENEEAFSRPFITIAREPGSGGVPIANEVAKKLGFECINEQITEEIARSTKLRRDIIKSVDEKSRSKIEDMVHSMLNSEYIDDVKYVTELTRIMLTYAHKGKVVLVGRGANFVTPFGKGLHVNVTAPYEVRVKRAMDFEGIDREKAEEVIAAVEKERKSFVKQYLRRDSNKINSYDLTINTTYFPVSTAADLIIEAFYKKFPRITRYTNIFRK
jgi:cytidylate kinase